MDSLYADTFSFRSSEADKIPAKFKFNRVMKGGAPENFDGSSWNKSHLTQTPDEPLFTRETAYLNFLTGFHVGESTKSCLFFNIALTGVIRLR